MFSLEYGFVLTLVLAIFPLSVNKMKVALEQEDIESFSVWVFIASFVAGLPFMVITLAIAI